MGSTRANRIEVTNPNDIGPTTVEVGEDRFWVITSFEMESLLRNILRQMELTNFHLNEISGANVSKEDING